jgi:murein DD-endopeptidase MepM/ murein hydrolase activator NlpD
LYGYRTNPTTGELDFHTGIDIAAGYGTPVLAAADGVVVTADYDADGYGIYCIIDHGDGNRTLYGHMSARHVNTGDTLNQGEEIGKVGSTGWSTGNHIHFETSVNGTRVDPLGFFSGD